ncbi:MAG: FxsA family protein [Thermodesulfobacteriota bacterium]|nr:FxsA family protein [Thermodesulfobacteriota bacterium]
MLLKLFLCFTLIPVIELYLLIKIGAVIGGFNAILIVIATGFFGAWLARMEGIQTMLRVRSSLEQGIMPADDLVDALIILIAGIILITPGFLTDAGGLLLLWPVTRKQFKTILTKKFNEMQSRGTIDITRM